MAQCLKMKVIYTGYQNFKGLTAGKEYEVEKKGTTHHAVMNDNNEYVFYPIEVFLEVSDEDLRTI